MTRLRTVRVYVVGDVQRPGAYDISSLSTPLNALTLPVARRPPDRCAIVKHYRGSELISEQDLYDLLIFGVRKAIEHCNPATPSWFHPRERRWELPARCGGRQSTS